MKRFCFPPFSGDQNVSNFVSFKRNRTLSSGVPRNNIMGYIHLIPSERNIQEFKKGTATEKHTESCGVRYVKIPIYAKGGFLARYCFFSHNINFKVVSYSACYLTIGDYIRQSHEKPRRENKRSRR